MHFQLCFSVSEDTFPLPRHIKERYGPFGFPERRDTRRPYISSNFVMGLDGCASFRELKGRAGGREVSSDLPPENWTSRNVSLPGYNNRRRTSDESEPVQGGTDHWDS